jgi:hypothetical protein
MTNTNLVEKALWKTPANQDRLIFRISGDQVIHATRGGNVMNEFESGKVTSVADFVAQGEFHSIVSDALFEKAKTNLGPWLEKQPD